jgi:ATP-dependent Lhr-like helicase
MSLIPDIIQQWFESRQWRVRDFQRQVMEKAHHANAVLLMAPTGAGKTLSGFLPALSDLATGGATHNRLHTLYISPLKALTQDIHRNLLIPIEDMALSIKVETRTGDTPSHKRQRQRRQPPHILLTTPESLMLMLSYADAHEFFA